jgi:hypothetical protein
MIAESCGDGRESNKVRDILAFLFDSKTGSKDVNSSELFSSARPWSS